MIKIEKRINTGDIERLYSELEGQDGLINILLPAYIESNDIGITSHIIQFVSTWVRKANAGFLLLNIPNQSDECYNDFLRESYAFPCIIMCWDKGIFDFKTNENLKPKLRDYNKEIHKKMLTLDVLKGQRLLLTCFDHLWRDVGLLNAFYNDNEFITSDTLLSFILYPSIEKVLAASIEVKKKNVKPGIIDDLILIIYELMKNTDDWARTDEYNQTLNPNVRGLFANFLRRKKEAFVERYINHEGLKDYFDTIAPNDQDEIYLLELSVFDSGIGFIDKKVGSKIGEAMSPLEQANLIKECLIKNVTNEQGIYKHSKGLGLDRILRTLDDTGFFWIRTGNVSLYRNLKKDRYTEIKAIEEIQLYDWSSHTTNQITSFDRCAGSVINIIYPINYR